MKTMRPFVGWTLCLDRAEEKAADAAEAKEHLQKEVDDAAEAKDRLQRESSDREEQLTTVVDSREKEMPDRMMAAAKAFSGEYLSLDLVLYFLAAPCLILIWVISFFVSEDSGIAFDRGALEHGSALDDATAVVED